MNSIKELKEQLDMKKSVSMIHLHFTVPNAESAAFTGRIFSYPRKICLT